MLLPLLLRLLLRWRERGARRMSGLRCCAARGLPSGTPSRGGRADRAAQHVPPEAAVHDPPDHSPARPQPAPGPSAWSVASPRGAAGGEWWWAASTERERAELAAALDLALELARGLELASAARLPGSPRRPGTPRAPLTPRCAPPSSPA